MMKSNNSYYKLLKEYTPCGAQTLSKMHERYADVYPHVLSHGDKGHVWDEEGNEYIDLISGLGAISVGYNIPSINKAITDQVKRGVSFSLPNKLEYLAAKKLTELVPWTEMWKFGKNGTDGTVMAVRAARAYTGRDKILTVGYNGCADVFEIVGTRNAGIPTNLKEHIVKANYNEIDTFKRLENNFTKYACVLLEPMVFEYPKPGFLEQLRELCTNNGTLLIFDEVVTGGRFKSFTASSYFKVQPDLIVLSKGIANGLPLSAVGGKRSIMQTFERGDFFASGTFSGECVALAAFLETQNHLVKSIQEMLYHGRLIANTYNTSWGLECSGYPTRLTFNFPSLEHKTLFWQEMCLAGVLVGYTNFIMASHTREDVKEIQEAIKWAIWVVEDNWNNPLDKISGSLPVAAIRK